MNKPQITVRISPSLLMELNNYVEKTGTSKTDVVTSAIATYLGCGSAVPLSQRVAEMEMRMENLEAEVRGKLKANTN